VASRRTKIIGRSARETSTLSLLGAVLELASCHPAAVGWHQAHPV